MVYDSVVQKDGPRARPELPELFPRQGDDPRQIPVPGDAHGDIGGFGSGHLDLVVGYGQRSPLNVHRGCEVEPPLGQVQLHRPPEDDPLLTPRTDLPDGELFPANQLAADVDPKGVFIHGDVLTVGLSRIKGQKEEGWRQEPNVHDSHCPYRGLAWVPPELIPRRAGDGSLERTSVSDSTYRVKTAFPFSEEARDGKPRTPLEPGGGVATLP